MNVFITGMTGTGKSTFAQQLIRRVNLPVYAFSNKIEDYYMLRENSRKNFIIVNVQEGQRVKSLPDKNIFFNFEFITHDGKIEFMNSFAQMLMVKHDVVVYLDEAHEVLSNQGRYSKILEAAIAGGRAKGIHFIIISQRPQNVRKAVINNCKWIVSFKLNEPKSVEAVVKHMQGIDEEDIRNLPLYKCYIYNAYTGKLGKC